MYSWVEEQRLLYLSREQNRQANYDDNENMTEDDKHAHRLPSSFMGSRAWASEQTADSMALAKAFGRPLFFCTMTFNPNWPEFQE